MAKDPALIRQLIAEETVATGMSPELELLAARMNIGVANLIARIREEPPLEHLLGLTPSQALQLKSHYNDFEMFAPEVKAILQSFIETRENIREIEKGFKK